MYVTEEILKRSCTPDCPRYCAATCPYHLDEKQFCPRVKEILGSTDRQSPEN